MDFIDYKRADILSQFVQERGKILPRRMTGVCSRHQRWLGEAIKRARNIALLPFAGSAAGTQAPRVATPAGAHPPAGPHAPAASHPPVAPAAPATPAPHRSAEVVSSIGTPACAPQASASDVDRHKTSGHGFSRAGRQGIRGIEPLRSNEIRIKNEKETQMQKVILQEDIEKLGHRGDVVDREARLRPQFPAAAASWPSKPPPAI